MTSLPVPSAPVPTRGWLRLVPALFQGAVIGLVELIPGVSGGTMALVLGIYARLIRSANHAVHGVVSLVRRRSVGAALQHLKQVEWALILPLLAGMVIALFTLAGPLHHFVDTQPVIARALFFGMVLASLLVPLSMVRHATSDQPTRHLRHAALVLAVAALAFVLLGFPALQVDEPRWWVLIISGAVAVCALVLPGLSGSFVLLTVGMYEPTLEAVSSRDFGYIALFGAGAVVGMVTIVRLLAYLLREHQVPTLLIATGLILGSVRALWPWQDDTSLLAPEPGAWAVPLAVALVGAATVIFLWWVGGRARRLA